MRDAAEGDLRSERGTSLGGRRSDPAPAFRAPAPRASESRLSDPGRTDPAYPEAAYPEAAYPESGYTDPPLDREERQADQRYDGYTEPPRTSGGDPGYRSEPPAWLAAPRAAAPRVPEPRAAETGWRAPRPRDPAPPLPADEPEYDAGYPDPHGGRPLDDRYAAAEPMFPARTESLALGRDEPVDYDPRYAPGADGAFETGEYYDPERGPETYGRPGAAQGTEADDHGYAARPHARRNGTAIAAALMALAVLGTAGAYGYRVMKGGTVPDGTPPVIRADTSPKKIASAVQGGDKQIYERVGGQNERVVPREEQPVAIRDPAGGYPDATSNLPPVVSAPATVPAAASPGTAGAPGEPRKIRTVTIRPDGEPASGVKPAVPVAAPPARPVRSVTPAAPAGNAPMAITPQPAAPAARPQTAMVTPAPSAAASGNYVVQLSAQKTPEEARASFRAMQSKYPSVLSNRQVLVKKKDLGARGVFYGSQVGPFASRGDAVELCESLKAAGGNCIVQRN